MKLLFILISMSSSSENKPKHDSCTMIVQPYACNTDTCKAAALQNTFKDCKTVTVVDHHANQTFTITKRGE